MHSGLRSILRRDHPGHPGHPAELVDRWRKPPGSQCHQQRRISKLPVRHVGHVAAVLRRCPNRQPTIEANTATMDSPDSTPSSRQVGMTQAMSPSVPHMVSPVSGTSTLIRKVVDKHPPDRGPARPECGGHADQQSSCRATQPARRYHAWVHKIRMACHS